MDEPYLKELKSYLYSMRIIAIDMNMNDVSPDIPSKYIGSYNLWNYNYGASYSKQKEEHVVSS